MTYFAVYINIQANNSYETTLYYESNKKSWGESYKRSNQAIWANDVESTLGTCSTKVGGNYQMNFKADYTI